MLIFCNLYVTKNDGMMKNSLLMILVVLGMASCNLAEYETGNGDITSEKRQVDNFNEIHLTGNFEIGLKEGPKEQVVIVTDANLLDLIETEVENEVLVVSSRKKIRSDQGIKVYVTYQNLEALKSIGASIIKSDAPILTERFELEVPGASLIDLEVDTKDLEILLAGACSVKLKGKAENQSIALKGVGNLEAFDLESRSCEVRVSGMGGVEVNVKENLIARVNGVGSIKYKGSPQTVDDKVSGIGTIQAVDYEDSESI